VPTSAPRSGSEFRPVSVGELSRLVTERHAARGGLQIVGGRTALPDLDDGPSPIPLLSTAALTRVVDYPARDMTITVEAGLRMEELQRVLQEQAQRLPIDVPEAHRATLGGAMALNVSGPGRFGHGTFRDYVIGVKAVDGQGRLFAAGGRVVKNVAGYDLCKLLVGSRGQLAVIAEVTFKLRPAVETRRLVWAQLPGWVAAEQALANLTTTATRPVAVEVLNPPAAASVTRESKLAIPETGVVLCVAFEGTDRETDWQATTFQLELARVPTAAIELIGPDDADDLWTALVEYPAASDDPATLQAVTPPSRILDFAQFADARRLALQVHAASGVCIGHLPDSATEPSSARRVLEELRDRARSSGGSFQLLRCDETLATPLAALFDNSPTPLERRIKQALDPHGILNPHSPPT
jgi:glycolate oxidase FAD binding subunit